MMLPLGAAAAAAAAARGEDDDEGGMGMARARPARVQAPRGKACAPPPARMRGARRGPRRACRAAPRRAASRRRGRRHAAARSTLARRRRRRRREMPALRARRAHAGAPSWSSGRGVTLLAAGRPLRLAGGAKRRRKRARKRRPAPPPEGDSRSRCGFLSAELRLLAPRRGAARLTYARRWRWAACGRGRERRCVGGG
eukprot:scaffold5834_cov376-Prasinococcus_capsulatus_cf.AAC.1